jgi:uncharacterized membrane protein YphA (DoxX/SURF4 family)
MTTTHTSARPHRALHVTLWVLQILLAAAFLAAGMMKLTTPIAQLATSLPWVTDVSAGLVRLIGLAEVAGALGLILPAATRIRPSLTPLAALGLVAVMVLAGVFHLTRGEAAGLPVNLVLAALAGVIAWGRTRKVPIPAR